MDAIALSLLSGFGFGSAAVFARFGMQGMSPLSSTLLPVVVSFLPNMAEGQLQTSGNLVGTESFQRIGRVAVVIEVLDDMSEFNLPTGSRAQVAIYSDHFHHIAIMRKILLRMSSWQNYLYLDH